MNSEKACLCRSIVNLKNQNLNVLKDGIRTRIPYYKVSDLCQMCLPIPPLLVL